MTTHISILTVFEQLYKPFLQTSLIHSAQDKGIVNINVNSFFSYVSAKKRIDSPTFGPGPGMLIRPKVVEAAIEDKKRQYGPAVTIFFSPQGVKIDQQVLVKLAKIMQHRRHILLVPARYEGMDARVENYYADLVLSIGDFVLMGGDLPAMIFLEGILRLFPGVVGKEESVEEESFSGPFVDFPAYTRPVEWKGHSVPAVVRSGNHAAIREWRSHQAARTTVLEHFDWLQTYHVLTKEQKELAEQYIPFHYMILLYNDITENDEESRSFLAQLLPAISSIAEFYGIKEFFTNNFSSFDTVVEKITKENEERPLLIAFAGLNGNSNYEKLISFHSQSFIWRKKRPILFVLSIEEQLPRQVKGQLDFLLPSPNSLAGKGNLPISSLVAIALDRWLGLNPK